MKKFYSLLVAFFAIFACGLSAQNLLENGDFEDWTNGAPTNWEKTSAGNATVSEGIGRTGKAVVGAAVAGSNKRLAYKATTLKAGTYTFTFWAKGGQCKGGYVPLLEDGTPNSNKYTYAKDYATLSEEAWTEVSYEFTLEEATPLQLVIMVPKSNDKIGYTATDLTVDDASLTTKDGGIAEGGTEPEPEPENVYLNASFADEASFNTFTIENGTLPAGLDRIWAFDAQYGAKASGFTDNVKYATEAKLTSPVIDLAKCHSAELSFMEAGRYFGTFADEAKVLAREEGGEWQEVAVSTTFDGNTWTPTKATADLSPFCGKKIQIAFQYSSTEEAAGTWQVKNVKVTGDVPTGIDAIEQAPAAKGIYTLDGRRVEKAERGLYIIDGKKTYVK